MIEITDEIGLNKMLKLHPKVLALFYASWCPFCRNFLSVFNRFAQKPGDLEYIKVRIDEDENPLWNEFSLESVPSIILFENGQLTRRLDCNLGAGLSEKDFSTWLRET